MVSLFGNRVVNINEISIKYRNVDISIGTMENLYYTSYQKFADLIRKGELHKVEGNLPQGHYAKPDSGFLFRFPFPDEDRLAFGEILENYNRGVPVNIRNSVIPKSGISSEQADPAGFYKIEITQQKLVHRKSDGKLCLAMVFRDPGDSGSYRVEDDATVKSIISELLTHHVVRGNDRNQKNFYWQMAYRILKGHALKTPEKKLIQQLNEWEKAAKNVKRKKGKRPSL